MYIPSGFLDKGHWEPCTIDYSKGRNNCYVTCVFVKRVKIQCLNFLSYDIFKIFDFHKKVFHLHLYVCRSTCISDESVIN